jgi:hypothetical protein
VFQNFYVGSGSRTAELYSLSPDWFDYFFYIGEVFCLWRILTCVEIVALETFYPKLFVITLPIIMLQLIYNITDPEVSDSSDQAAYYDFLRLQV